MTVALLLALALAPVPVHAAFLVLTDAQKTEAVRAGERSVAREDFGAEWRVEDGEGARALVITPFHRLAIAARHAAFRGAPLKPGEPERVLREQRERLVVWVYVRGGREDFARFYEPRLLVGDRVVKPSFVQNERTAVRQPDGSFLARCVYGFPTRDLTGTARVGLVVEDADGRDVTRFTIDLSTMR
ncbi:MAG TPA: hypothetical protein VFX28_02075 [Methylomirabilota bacterium]|nr:hypothetical protein [Methylomirabilota bacterium]